MGSIMLLLLYLRVSKISALIRVVINFVVCLASVAVFAWGYRNRWSFRTMFVAQYAFAAFDQLISLVRQIL